MDITTILAIVFVSLIASRLIGWFWHARLSSRTSNLEQTVLDTIERYADVLVNLGIALYIILWGTLTWLKFLSFNMTGFDLGIFDQAVWNSLRGRLFENTLLPDAPVLIGQRFSPILLAFVPLYAIWNSPIVLMSVQTIGLGIATLPIYWTARARIGRPLGLVIAVSYWLFPAVQYMGLFEFHESPLSVPLLAFATFFLLRKKYFPLIVCLGIALLVKEEIAFVVCAFGLYLFLVQRQFRLGIGLIVFSILWASLLLQVILPFFRGAEGYYYFSHGATGGAIDRYGYLGTSFGEIITTLLTRPLYVLQHVFILPKLEFVLLLLAPLALIPLLSPELLLLALPTFAISLLSDLNLNYSIRYHYTASLIPFLFFAAILGIERLGRWRNPLPHSVNKRNWGIGIMLISSSVLSYYFQSPGPLASQFNPSLYTLSTRTSIGHSMLESIPDDAIVAVQAGLIPYVTHRRTVLEFPAIPNLWQAEYFIADSSSPWYLLFQQTWDNWLRSDYFQIIEQKDGFILGQRRALPQFPNVTFGNAIRLHRFAIIQERQAQNTTSVIIPVEWLALRNIESRYTVQVQLVDRQGHVWSSDHREPCYAFCPTNRWQQSQYVSDAYVLKTSPVIPTGDYQISLAIQDPILGYYESTSDLNGNTLDHIVIGTVHIDKNKSNTLASQLPIEQPLYVDMGELRFLGTTNLPTMIRAGTVEQIGLYWRARSKPQDDYFAVVQLRTANGKVALEQAARPANGTWPTTQWSEGEVLLDWHDIELPSTLLPGNYQIVVLIRNAANKLVGETVVSFISVIE
jgi:uncharacterized membrane protein